MIVPFASAGTFRGAPARTPIKAPLRALAANPNYFTDGSGRAVYLTGSHTWNTLQDWGTNGVVEPVDFDAFVRMLVAHNHNFTLLWTTELPTFHGMPTTASSPPDITVSPLPWQRTGPGNASDGKPRFDLTKFNPEFFERLRSRVEKLNANGIYAGVYFFTGEWLNVFRFPRDGYPFTGGNNVNGIDDGGGTGSTTMTAPNAITALQDAYVRKVIDTLNDLPNVLWAISEEAPGDSMWWNSHLISLVRAYESKKPLQHPIGYPVRADSDDPTIVNSDADWIAPVARISPARNCGTGNPRRKVVINDSDHSYWEMWKDSARTNRNYFWINFTDGNQTVFMDPYVVYYPREGRNLPPSPRNGISPRPDPRWDNVRDTMGYIRSYADRMNLAAMSPRFDLSRTSHVIARMDPAEAELLVYSARGGDIDVDLSGCSAPFAVEWMDPATGAKTNGPDVAGGGRRIFRAPFSGDAVLYLKTRAPIPRAVTFSAAPAETEAYDIVEITATVDHPDAANPFTGASLTGSFARTGGGPRYEIEGFCDADDGSTYRIRFMPSKPGEYTYAVAFRQGSFAATASGTFRATDGHRKGPLRVDPAHPWHFIWEGTGEHYFFNGTTAYFLFNWKSERIIRYSIDRLHRLKVNRLRVTIAGRENVFFGEPVMNGGDFSTYPTPWPAQNAEDMFHPGFDYSRFYLEYWRRIEHALRFARDRDMTVSLVLDMNDNRVHPAAGSEDERRYIRYAVDRLAAFSNITWDLGDDMERYRDDRWVHDTGTWLERIDPYRHLATSHPVDVIHQDRTSPWFGFTSFQEWSRSQHAFILRERALQEKTGRIIPQTNEEYGYEDHYPLWAPGPGSETADVLRRTAWDIYMAGGYQTAGESARRGTNILPDTGGGWLNGRGDDTQTMFVGFGHIVDFFTSFDWWRTNPHDELVSDGAYCLAEPGEIYAVYLPKGGAVTLRLGPGTYAAHWFGASTGETIPLPPASGPSWTSPKAPDRLDWALLLLRQK